MMTDIICEVHGFSHLSSNNEAITKTETTYNNNDLMKIIVEGKIRYCRFHSSVQINNQTSHYAFEMNEECPDSFICDERKVVLFNTVKFYQANGNHDLLKIFSDKIVDERSVCCMNKIEELSTSNHFNIGRKFLLPITPIINYMGLCKWIGKINNVECIGAEMVNWISNDSNGSCMGMKIFECGPGHGVFIRCQDVKIDDNDDLEYQQDGFVDLKNVYYVKEIEDNKERFLRVGRRVEVIYCLNKVYEHEVKLIYGTLKWIGTINKCTCVGIELDNFCVDAMDGVISCSHSFNCREGHGVVCNINSVTFDYYIYSVEFTVNETFNIDCEIIHIEDWNQEIVKEKDLKKDSNIFVDIDNNQRYFLVKGILRWCGYIQGVSVGVLEMDENFPITKQQKIVKILNNVKPVAYITVNTEYLCKYNTVNPFKKPFDGVEGYDIGAGTKFGVVTWHGVDCNDNLFYGFEADEPVEDGTDGTFDGQSLFICNDGCGTLISAQTIRKNIHSEVVNSKKKLYNPSVPEVSIDDCMELLITVANDNGISSDELLNTAMNMDNKGVIGPLLDNITPPINISKHSEMINQLFELQFFDSLKILLEKCSIEDNNNKLLLMVAAESLKYEKTELFERCMNKCTNKDILMDNGETLITHLIKENIDQSLIIKAIEKYEFNVSKANEDNCLPLTLACNNMMTDVIGCIVLWIKNQKLSIKVCSICLDRNITTVFNCGHNSCKECSENISQCHICKEVITSRGLLYFN